MGDESRKGSNHLKLSSLQNTKVKYLRSLYKKKYRRQEQKFVLEGLRLVEEAFEVAEVEQLFYSEYLLRNNRGEQLLADCEEQGIESYQLTDQLLQQVADTESPQGVLAVVDQDSDSLEAVFAEQKLLVVVDQVQDPGNLGTIIRTADAAGADGVVTTKGTVSFYNQKTIRATMGSLLRLPVYRVAELDRLKQKLSEKKLQILAGDLEAEKYHFEADFTQPTALIVGSEARGIQAELLELVDQKIKIPLRGGAESLNVAMATSVLLYEGVRQQLT